MKKGAFTMMPLLTESSFGLLNSLIYVVVQIPVIGA